MNEPTMGSCALVSRSLHPGAVLRACGIAVLACALFAGGCATQKYVTLREVPKNPLSAQLDLLSRSGPKPSSRTMQLLRRYDLVEALDGDSQKLLDKFHAFAIDDPSPENIYGIAELSYLGAKKQEGVDEQKALDLYGAAVLHAYIYLFDRRFAETRNPYDPEYRGACDVYNTALEGALRIVQKRGLLKPGHTHTIETASRNCDVQVVLRSPGWHDDEFSQFAFTSDYAVSGLRNHYQGHGLGVPLVAQRQQHEDRDQCECFYPPKLSVPATAFLRLVDTGDTHLQMVCATDARKAKPRMQAVLELYDPIATPDVQVCNRLVPLESDLTTPLAYFLSQPELDATKLSTVGLLDPDRVQQLAGVYMLQPYQPGKIPVIMVHGLWSTPFTWMEMFNDLRADPTLRERYQFWFYLYPTGKPFWISAAKFRDDLKGLREKLDPARQQPALDHMVLVGHSMGGLMSKLQAVDSGNLFWNAVTNNDFADLKASPDVRATLEKTFFFHPNPDVHRVVTIGTPHRGSEFANDITQYLARRLISMPQMFTTSQQALVRDNPKYFRDQTLLSINNSIDSLSPTSPFLKVLLDAPAPPTVHFHNIVGLTESGNILRRVGGTGDGVVKIDSAKLDHVESQIVVTADHSQVHSHPLAIREVRRILISHLHQVYGIEPAQPIQLAVRPDRVTADKTAPAAPTAGEAPATIGR